MVQATRRQGLEVITFIADFVARRLLAAGLKPLEAVEAGKECAGGVAESFGGQQFYLPRDAAGRPCQR